MEPGRSCLFPFLPVTVFVVGLRWPLSTSLCIYMYMYMCICMYVCMYACKTFVDCSPVRHRAQSHSLPMGLPSKHPCGSFLYTLMCMIFVCHRRACELHMPPSGLHLLSPVAATLVQLLCWVIVWPPLLQVFLGLCVP